MKKYSVLVEAESWVSVEAESEAIAIEEAKGILQCNFYAWDSVDATIMNEEDMEE